MNYNKIKRDYLSSDLNLAQIARKHGIPYSTIKKRAAREGWKAERDEKRQEAEEKLQQVRTTVSESVQRENEAIAETIYNSAKRLVELISGVDFSEVRSSYILNYAKALRELTSVIREIKGIQTVTEKQTYELAKERLDLDKKRILGLTTDEDESGVVLLPEIKVDE